MWWIGALFIADKPVCLYGLHAGSDLLCAGLNGIQLTSDMNAGRDSLGQA